MQQLFFARSNMSDALCPLPGSITLGALILAAGKGTRMRSDKPKVLQRLLEEPMLRYVYDAVTPLCPRSTWTVVGHRADMLEAAFAAQIDSFILQEPQLGTGHALQIAMPTLEQACLSHVLIVNGDTPLLTEEIIREFCLASLNDDADISFITLTLPDPAAFGRVVRKDGEVSAIVEAKDYDPAVHGVETGEINAGIYCLKLSAVAPFLGSLSTNNKSGELYLTDLIGMGVAAKLRVTGVKYPEDPALMGINNPVELIRSEEALRRKIVDGHAAAGVIIRAAGSVRIGPDVRIEPGTEIVGPCELYGVCNVGRGSSIASHCRLQDADIGRDVQIHSFSHIQEASVAAMCTVGPYARLRPGAVMEDGAHVGNFVEMKKARLGKGAKANHLTYLGDAEVGAKANIGAGTITCNYDGVNKHRTVIGEKAFIGSNSALVAPVTIGAGAVVGAGSVITKAVPDKNLAVARGKQQNIDRSKRS